MPQRKDRHQFKEIINGRPTQTGKVKSPPRDWIYDYVAHIRKCETCYESILFHFMTANQMAQAIIINHHNGGK